MNSSFIFLKNIKNVTVRPTNTKPQELISNVILILLLRNNFLLLYRDSFGYFLEPFILFNFNNEKLIIK